MCSSPLLNSLLEFGYSQRGYPNNFVLNNPISGIPKTLCQRSRGSRGKDWTHIQSGYLGQKEKADILTTQKISLQ